MKITIEAESKEIADLMLKAQSQLTNTSKIALKQILSKFCDDFSMHDEQIDACLEKITE